MTSLAVFVSFFFYKLFYCCALARKARVRITAKDITEGASLSEERDHLSEGEEDLSNVEANPKVWAFAHLCGPA